MHANASRIKLNICVALARSRQQKISDPVITGTSKSSCFSLTWLWGLAVCGATFYCEDQWGLFKVLTPLIGSPARGRKQLRPEETSHQMIRLLLYAFMFTVICTSLFWIYLHKIRYSYFMHKIINILFILSYINLIILLIMIIIIICLSLFK